MSSSVPNQHETNDSKNTSAPQHEDRDQEPKPSQPLPLPEPSTSTDGATAQLNVGGQAVKLDHLGPLVVNKDGTLSRIANWDTMTEIERQNTLRILVKRNQVRTEALKEAAGNQEN